MAQEEELTRAELERVLIDDVRSMSYRSQRLADAFATQQAMHATDLEALVHVLHGERAARPLTVGHLGEALNLSPAATSGVVDRLQRSGHLTRERDEADRRRVHLRTTPAATAVAGRFFGPLGVRTADVMATFGTEELAAVHRFLLAMTRTMADVEELHRTGR